MTTQFNGTIEEYKQFLNTELSKYNKTDKVDAVSEELENPQKKVVTNHEYVDLGLPSGTLWAKCNIGASSEEEYGEYFNWEDASKYNLPSKEQFKELYDECNWKWCSANDKNGYLVIGKNGNYIFLPAAGFVSGSSLFNAGTSGYYWSSSLNNANYAYFLYFYSDGVYPQHISYRYRGFTIRSIYKHN